MNNYINYKFSDGYDIGTPFEAIIEDYHGEKAKERALEWERIYGFLLTYGSDHILCSYKNQKGAVNLTVWMDNDRYVMFSVCLEISDEFEGSAESLTIEDAIEDYKLTIHKFLLNDFEDPHPELVSDLIE